MNEHEATSTDSDQPAKEPTTAETTPAAEPAKGGMSPLRIILFVILLGMVAALAYDWAVAMPASKEAVEKVQDLVTESASRPASAPQADRAEVQKLIGHAPNEAKQRDGGHYIIQEYQWTRGLPVLPPYYALVVFNKKKVKDSDEYEYSVANVIWNSEPEPIELPGGPVKPPVHTEPTETDDSDDPTQSEDEDNSTPPVDDSNAPAETDAPAGTDAPNDSLPSIDPEPETPAEEPASTEDPAPAETEPDASSADNGATEEPAETPAAEEEPAVEEEATQE